MNDRNLPDAGRFEVRALGKDVLVYSAGNGLLLIFTFIQALIIPKYLSVAGYGYWQLFNLYITYVGILHLGFLDGLLVRWAGKDLNQIGGEIKPAIRFLVLEQLVVTIPLGFITYFLLQPPLQWIGLMIFAYAFIQNLIYFFIFTTQAIRQFRLLTVLNVVRGLVFLIFIVLLLISGHLEYHYVIVASLASSFLFMFALAVRYRRYLWRNHAPAPSLASFGKRNINIGVFILLGNFIFVVFFTLDRLLVSSFFAIERFAVYAFAMAVAQLAFIFIRAVADVLFPHLSAAAHEQRTRAYQMGKRLIILCWALFLGAYFPLAALIQFYLPHYTGSLPIIKILMGTMGLSSLILILHANYYRLYRKQRQYFSMGITALALAVLLALIAIKTLGTLESVAIAMLISFFVWYIINSLSLKSVTGESGRKIGKDLMIMGCYVAGFWFASFLGNWVIAQMLIYAGFFLVISFGFFSSDITSLLSMVRRSRANRS
jgi:O-antigen/teichoic acid export membrane protein